MAGNRVDRINSEIQKIAAKVIREEIKDPVVVGQIVSIVGVRTSVDLTHSKVFVSILGDDKTQKKVFLHVKKAEKFIQKRVSEELGIRKAPEIVIVYDESIEQGQRVLQLLEKIKKDEHK